MRQLLDTKLLLKISWYKYDVHSERGWVRNGGEGELRQKWDVIGRKKVVSVRLELSVQGQGGGRILDIHEQGGGDSWKLDNSPGRHMCIVPCCKRKIFSTIKKSQNVMSIATLLKRDSSTRVCLCKIFKNSFFYRTASVAATVCILGVFRTPSNIYNGAFAKKVGTF